MIWRIAIVVAMIGALGSDVEAEADELERAREHYKKGKAHHDAGEYEQAAAEYAKSYELSNAPVLLYNLAQVERLGGHPEKALEHYKQYLEADPDGPGAERAKEFVAALTKELEEAKKAEEHGKTPEVVEPDSDPDKARPIEPEPNPNPVVMVRPPVDRPEPGGNGGRVEKISGVVVGGLGLVSIGLGIKFGLDARSKADDVAELSGVWDPADEEIWDDGEAAERNSIIFLSAGAAAVAGGAVLYLLGSRAANKAPESRVTATPVAGSDSFGVALSGHF